MGSRSCDGMVTAAGAGLTIDVERAPSNAVVLSSPSPQGAQPPVSPGQPYLVAGVASARYGWRVRTEDLDYELPEEQIAQAPLAERDAARLLVVRPGGSLEDRAVRELPSLLPPCLLVVNDTRVIPARLFGTKPSGGKVELLLIERRGAPGPVEQWQAMGRASKGLRPGTHVHFDGLEAQILSRADDGTLEVELRADDVTARVEAIGAMPLPPYIRRAASEADTDRYQTVFARVPGAVAAPTAGLHFSQRLVTSLERAGHRCATVTLHVGPGTFRPIKSDRLEEHPMHEERYRVPAETVSAIAQARKEGRPVLAVGTTVVRTLESAATEKGLVRKGEGRTRLFIRPPYRPRVVDHVLTNFHLPRSTLLALVMALGGVGEIRAAYAHAVDAGYRLFSYGDAMLLRDVRRRP